MTYLTSTSRTGHVTSFRKNTIKPIMDAGESTMGLVKAAGLRASDALREKMACVLLRRTQEVKSVYYSMCASVCYGVFHCTFISWNYGSYGMIFRKFFV